MRVKFLAIVVAVLLIAPIVAAEKSIGLTLAQVSAERRDIIEATVEPDVQQAEEFWHKYWVYRGQIGRLNERTIAVIQEFTAADGDLRGDRAYILTNEVLDLTTQRADLKKRYVGEFKNILSAKQILRWYQTENKMDALIRAEMALSIPLDKDDRERTTNISRAEIQTKREAFLNALVQPSAKQEEKLWTEYRKYTKKLGKLEDRLAELIDEYAEGFGSLTDKQALQITKEAADIDTDKAKSLETVIRKLQSVLDAKQVVRVLQVEQKLDAMTRFDLALTIPVELAD